MGCSQVHMQAGAIPIANHLVTGAWVQQKNKMIIVPSSTRHHAVSQFLVPLICFVLVRVHLLILETRKVPVDNHKVPAIAKITIGSVRFGQGIRNVPGTRSTCSPIANSLAMLALA